MSHDPAGSATAVHFDEVHRRRPDPWNVTSSWYEIRKRAVTLAALPEAHVDRALEVGCSIGVLSAELAGRCGELVAVDLSGEAVARARERLAPLAHVHVERRDVRDGLPPGPFDLVVVSESGYYLDGDDLAALVTDVSAVLAPGGAVVACHWRRPEPDFRSEPAVVHAAFDAADDLHRLVHHEEAEFVLDVWSPDPRGVAGRPGATGATP